MMPAPPAFSRLHGALLRRRLAAIEPVLRLELVALAVLLGAFMFLQARPLLEDVEAKNGAWGVAIALEVAGLGLAAIGAWLVASRHRRRLRAPEGPAWMTLPVEAADVERHLAWDSKLQALWMALPVVAIAVAATGLLAFPWHLVLFASMAGYVWMGADLGAIAGRAQAARDAAARPHMPTALRILTDVAPPRSRPRVDAARFRHGPAWRALFRKDALLVGRIPALRQNLVVAVAFFAISLLGWFLPSAAGVGDATPGIDLRNLATFFVTLLAAVVLAEWLVLLAGSDPFGAIRALPIGVRDVWTARVAWAAGLTAIVLAGHGFAARGIALGPKLLFLSWVAGATLGLALLGVHVGLSLYPQTAAARRVLGIALGLMAIVSTVFFLMGWVVLLVAILHSARRLVRWERAESAEPA